MKNTDISRRSSLFPRTHIGNIVSTHWQEFILKTFAERKYITDTNFYRGTDGMYSYKCSGRVWLAEPYLTLYITAKAQTEYFAKQSINRKISHRPVHLPDLDTERLRVFLGIYSCLKTC